MIRRFSTRAQAELERSVACLADALEKSQASRPQSLLTVVNCLIDQHQSQLQLHYHIKESKDELWKLLSKEGDSRLQDLDNKILAERKQLFASHHVNSPPTTTKYNEFIRQLYPLKKHSSPDLNVDLTRKVIDMPHNRKKYDRINHSKIFKAFYDLPSPQPLQVEYRHFEHFLIKFLYKDDFIRPNAISKSYLDNKQSKPGILGSFNEMIARRAEYVNMVTKLFDDMRNQNIQLTVSEQNHLVYISFFKDNKSIVDKIKRVLPNESSLTGYSQFNWDIYQQIKRSMSAQSLGTVSIDSYNVLLFHAIRHEQQDIMNDILGDLGLRLEGSSTNVRANSATFSLVLEYISTQYRGNISDALSRIIDCIPLETVDITLLNNIVKCLCCTGQQRLGEQLVSKVFQHHQAQEEDSESVVYKLLTPEDKRLHAQLITILNNIRNITGCKESYRLVPTEGTFRPFIEQICQNGNYEQVANILEYMEKEFKLPLTTRVVQIVLDRFISYEHGNQWSLDELVDLVNRIISIHDYLYDINHDTLLFPQNDKNMFDVELSTKLQSFINNHLKEPSKMKVPVSKGSFMKLSDDVVDRVYRAFVSTLTRKTRLDDSDNSKEILKAVKVQKDQLQKQLEFVRGGKPRLYHGHASKQDIHNNDEITYIKKGHLVDLISLAGY